jgi:hypothetical protein
MRTVLRFGAAMAITILALGVAESCALPAYHAGESTSSGGGGDRGATSSSGQGGAASASSSSGSDADAGDASACNPDLWGHCPLDKQCSCKGQRCYNGDCSNAATLVAHVCDGAQWQTAPAGTGEIVCCPVPYEPCAPGGICLLTKINGVKTPSCVSNLCVSQNMADLCACKAKLCTNPLAQTCSMYGPGVAICE